MATSRTPERTSERTPSTRVSRGRIAIIIAAVVAVLALIATIVIISVRSAASDGTTSAQTASEGAPSALPDSTAMGAIELNVSNLEIMRNYYEGAVGLQALSEPESTEQPSTEQPSTEQSNTEQSSTEQLNTVELGLDVPLIQLREITEGEQTATPTEAGLYHSAILYPDEATLARTLLRIATVAPNSFQGSADHLVSLAFYFVDPEGNGLELYVDRPREEWVWNDGYVEMGSYELDPNEFITEHLGSDFSTELGVGAAATMGHVHMKVGDLDEAERFYADALGFAVTSRGNGAIFYAAGGYHHHLATNTWQSQGATARKNPTGLGSLTITVGSASELEAIATRLDEHGVNYEASDGDLVAIDPWGNRVRIALAPEAS